MKTITLWKTYRANTDPSRKGTHIHVTDPDPGVNADRRTMESGFGVPFEINIPDHWEASDFYGKSMLCADGDPKQLILIKGESQVMTFSAMATYDEAVRGKGFINFFTVLP